MVSGSHLGRRLTRGRMGRALDGRAVRMLFFFMESLIEDFCEIRSRLSERGPLLYIYFL